MAKAIKEIIIMLLVCLVVMLILAVVLYDYIPNRKEVAEVSIYETSAEMEALLADDIDSEEKDVIVTHEVTAKDLNTYEAKKQYVPGKANPFAVYAEPTTEEPNNNSNTTNENSTTNQVDSTENSNSFVDDGGTK